MRLFLLLAALLSGVAARKGFKLCRAYTDPHYQTFDRMELSVVLGYNFTRSAGNFLMVGTCGVPDHSPLTVWVEAEPEDGLIDRVEVSTTQRTVPLRFVFLREVFVECQVGQRRYHLPNEVDECHGDAARHGIQLGRLKESFTVSSIGAGKQKAWDVLVNVDPRCRIGQRSPHERDLRCEVFSSVDIHMRESVYRNEVRGLCGNMNGDVWDDTDCWNGSLDGTECWREQNAVFWLNGQRPGTCPALIRPRSLPQPLLTWWPGAKRPPFPESLEEALQRRNSELGPFRKRRSADAKDSSLCAIISDPSGPFQACLNAQERQNYVESCEQDEAAVGGGCVLVRDLAAFCHREYGIQVDLGKSKCAA